MTIPATVNDVVAAYRLILGRDPDTAGLQVYSNVVSSGGTSTLDLADLFINSPEALGVRSRRSARDHLSTVDVGGVKMIVAPSWNSINREIAETGAYEPHLTAYFRQAIRPGMTFVDIGANVGYFSLLAASLGASVHAFEPNSRNVWLLNKNARAFGERIAVYPSALADADRLVAYSSVQGNGQISEIDDEFPPEGQEVLRTTTLDKALAGVRPDIIKIDVEGAEGLVLRGADKSLANRPIVTSEFSADGISRISAMPAADYLAIFTDLGYRLSICDRTGAVTRMSAEEVIKASDASPHGFVDIIAEPLRT